MPPQTKPPLLFAVAGAFFVCLFLPWYQIGGHRLHGWSIEIAYVPGVLALGVVLVELARTVRVWLGGAPALVSVFLAAATGVMGLATLFNLRWGGILEGSFSRWCYGAWLGLALAVAVLALAGREALTLRLPR